MNGVVLLRVERTAGRGGHPRHLHPALDLKIIEAGLYAAGIPVSLVDGWQLAGGPADWVAAALATHARIAVIKAETWCLPEAIECARQLQIAGVQTIAIGQQVVHAMRAPVAGWNEAFAMALAGEAEEELIDILPRLLRRQDGVQQSCARRFDAGHRFAVRDQDGLPLPVFSVTEMESFAFPFPLAGRPLRRWAYVLSARGCPHRCRHCSTVVRKSDGDRLRGRSPRRVVDEIAAHLAAGAEAIAFEDDTLLVDRRHFLAICDELVRRGVRVPWMANARPDELDDERVAAAAAAGAMLLKLGIETVTPRLIEAMGKSRHGDAWQAQTEAGMARLKRHGIGAVGLFLVGLPTQTVGEVTDTLRWAQRLAPDYVQVQIFRAYPDIDWWADLPPQVRDLDAAYHYGPIGETAAAIPAQDLGRMQRDFYRRFYLRPGFAWSHARRCWRHYGAAKGIGAALRHLGYVLRHGLQAPATPREGLSHVD
ncbi:MAG: radical SAM protein [Rhodocyclales bacterium]|nr:radical SAM protein [Rhodocyclales bacterium]